MFRIMLQKIWHKNIFEIINHTCSKKLGSIINFILVTFIFIFAAIVFFNLVDFLFGKSLLLSILITYSIIAQIGRENNVSAEIYVCP